MRDPIAELLASLAAQGHSRTSAHKAAGMSWHTFRQVCADYPQIKWRVRGEQMPGRAGGNRYAKQGI